MLGWLTLSDADPLPRPTCLNIPANANWLACFTGALFELADAENWEESGSLTPDEMAQTWLSLLIDLWSIGNCGDETMRAGTVIMFAGSSTPDDFLLCDGASVEKAVYPELFEVIGYAWGGAGDNFNLPDLQGKFPLGVNGSHALATTGGAETHTLTAGEMPAHTHKVDVVAASGVVGGVTPAAGQDFGNLDTSSAGSGQAHNNMPPFASLRFLIRVRS